MKQVFNQMESASKQNIKLAAVFVIASPGLGENRSIAGNRASLE
jgi:hypothetical protein